MMAPDRTADEVIKMFNGLGLPVCDDGDAINTQYNARKDRSRATQGSAQASQRAQAFSHVYLRKPEEPSESEPGLATLRQGLDAKEVTLA